MAFDLKTIRSELEEKLVSIIGRHRFTDVSCELLTDGSGNPLLKVTVVYPSERPLTVQEMSKYIEQAWPTDEQEGALIPIIDFQETADDEPVAAE